MCVNVSLARAARGGRGMGADAPSSGLAPAAAERAFERRSRTSPRRREGRVGEPKLSLGLPTFALLLYIS